MNTDGQADARFARAKPQQDDVMIDALKTYTIALSHPRAARALFDPRPAWVWAANGEKILWANEAGCRFFDTKSMPDLLSRGFRRIAPATHLIARVGASGALNEDEQAILRFFRGMTPIALTSEVERIVLADGTDAVFVQSVDENEGLQTRPAAKMARRLMKLFSRGDAATAILQPAGTIEEASDRFRAAVAADGTMAHLLTAEAERLLVHQAEMKGRDGNTASPFIMALLPHDDDAAQRIFVALVDDSERDQETGAEDDIPAAPIEPLRPMVQEEPITAESETPTDEPDKIAAGEIENGETEAEITGTDAIGGMAAHDHPPAATASFTFKRQERPTRFLFTFDRDLCVTSLSPEFMAALGPETGAIIGESWPDIAERFGLDREGSIARKIAQQAIWSETVQWPVSSAPEAEAKVGEAAPRARLRVPTTITAMPVFNGQRTFEGFRGFGSIMTGEASFHDETDAMPAPSGNVAAEDPQVWERFLATTPLPEPLERAPLAPDTQPETGLAASADDAGTADQGSVMPETTGPDPDADSTLDWVIDAEEDAGLSPQHPAFENQPEHLFDVDSPHPARSAEGSAEGDENKIVPLRRRPFAVRALPQEDELASLSKPEQQAFRKIAMALSARIEGEPADFLPDPAEEDDLPPANDGTKEADILAPVQTPAPAITPQDDLIDFDAASIIEGRRRAPRKALSPEADTALEAIAPLDETPAPSPAATPSMDADETSQSAEKAGSGENDLDEGMPEGEPLNRSRYRTPDERAADLFDAETPPYPLGQSDPVKTFSKGLGAGAAAILAAQSAKTAGSIPERDVAERAPSLEKSEETQDNKGTDDTQLREGVLNRLPLGLIVSRDRQVLFANQSALDFLGFPDEEAFRAAGGVNTLFIADTEADPGSFVGRDMLKHLVIRADQQEGHIPQAVRARIADGSTIAIDLRLQSGKWQGEDALLLALSARSTEQAPAVSDEQKISALLGQSTHIMDIASDGLLVIDAKGTLIHANSSAEALFGRDRADLRDLHFSTLFADESKRSVCDYLESLTSNGVASVLNDGREVIGREAQGGLIPLFITIGRLDVAGSREANTLETGVYCVVLRDITHWKRAEEELIESRRLAENANAQKSDFLAAISHEIRTPLNAIIGFSEVMMEQRFGPIDNPRYLEYARDINVSGNHLISLVNDLLDLSKIEAGKLDLTFSSVALNTVIQEAVALMQPEANRDRIIIRTSLSDQLPPVVADVRSIRQIALNLLSNAVKFTKAGGQVIISTSFEENGEVAIRVRDTGIGMSEQDLDYAMQPFRQVQKDQEGRKPGTGLGLPLTKALAEANRARFSIDSRVNYGTLIQVIFPNERVLAR